MKEIDADRTEKQQLRFDQEYKTSSNGSKTTYSI
jgi:hypothetical protein